MEDYGKFPGIYVHVPFCRRKCPYCDFYSITDTNWLPAYFDALMGEIRMAPQPPGPYDTVYIGGGTPSLLTARQIESLLEALFKQFEIAGAAEITLEVNPGTVSAEGLKRYRAAGINRLNIGVQSFNDDMLRFLGRIHSGEKAGETIRRARAAGYDNIGLDLIYGLPGQSTKAWHRDLCLAMDFLPAHLSCYLLTYAPGTPLAEQMNRNRFTPLDEETRREMFLFTHDFLLGRGYEHYEISNFAWPEAGRSRHNQKYWRHAPYIGLGPAAHSYFNHRRHWNVSSVKQYGDCIISGKLPVEASEDLSVEQEMMEAVFLGLRCSEGICIDLFETRFGINFHTRFHDVLSRYQAAGYLSLAGGHCALTRNGFLYADSIAEALIQWI